MPLTTFNPPVPPSPGTKMSQKLKLRKAEFGDGYTQTTRDGINHIRRTLNLQWDILTPDQAIAIVSFLEERGGDEPFLYTPSDETVPIKWTCEEWDDERLNNGLRKVSCVLEQSFALV